MRLIVILVFVATVFGMISCVLAMLIDFTTEDQDGDLLRDTHLLVMFASTVTYSFLFFVYFTRILANIAIKRKNSQF